MFDTLQKFLRRVNGDLTDLQSIDLTAYRPNSAEANQLLQRFLAAAEGGDSYAIAICASCYRSGWGTGIDGAKAFRWAQRAAQTGFAPGVAELGYCYEEGVGTEPNAALALENLRRAAEAGYAMAALNLAVRFTAGKPYGASPREAMRYAELALQAGEPYAAHLLGSWYEEGTITPKSGPLARSWYERAAALGSQLACIRMATAHMNGELGLPRDPKKSADFFKLAEASTSP